MAEKNVFLGNTNNKGEKAIVKSLNVSQRLKAPGSNTNLGLHDPGRSMRLL